MKTYLSRQKESAKITTIQNGGISDFLPPISTVRDLPEDEGAEVVGKAEYESSCAVCHTDSSMGAPAVGDKAAWEKVKAKGLDAVLANAINGIGGMPPRGGSDLSDAKMKDAVDYMINASK